MRTITTTIYNVADIRENKQLLETILSNNRNINIYDNWFDFILEDADLELQQLGYNNIKINFTGFYSQGDGASFTADLELSEDVLKRCGIINLKQSQINLILDCFQVKVTRINSNYYHEKTIEIEVEIDCTNKNRIDNFLYKISNELEEFLSNEIIELSKDIYTTLENHHDYLISDEAILESLEADDQEFYEDGSLFND